MLLGSNTFPLKFLFQYFSGFVGSNHNSSQDKCIYIAHIAQPLAIYILLTFQQISMALYLSNCFRLFNILHMKLAGYLMLLYCRTDVCWPKIQVNHPGRKVWAFLQQFFQDYGKHIRIENLNFLREDHHERKY